MKDWTRDQAIANESRRRWESEQGSGRKKAHSWRLGLCLPWLYCLWHSCCSRVVPGWPARSGSVELGTSRVVGKQGERGEAKLSTRQTRLETRWREMKEIEKSETRERRGRTLNLPLHTYFTLFITILIGLNYPTFLFNMSGQKDIFLFGTFTGIGVYRKKP